MSGILIGLIIVSVLLVVSLYLNYRFVRMMLDTDDRINKIAEVFDSAETEITKVLEMPVFFDSIEVREVVRQIEKCRNAVIYAQNVITMDDEQSSD